MIYKHTHYLAYLREAVGQKGARTGHKGVLAEAIGCQKTYLSKVLNGDADLSLEQALKACEHFRLSEDESQYFMLLVSHARAGDTTLRQHFKKQIEQMRSKNVAVEQKIKVGEFITEKDQQVYYGHWYYMAAHIAVA